MKMRCILSLLLFSSCVEHFEENELYGYYTPVGYSNNFDTLQLKPQALYHRKVYDAKRRLLLERDGKWEFIGGNGLALSGFYLNADDDLLKFPELAKDTVGGINTFFETHNGKIEFCGVGHYPDKNCYQKIDD